MKYRYEQLANVLEEKIRSGEWSVGTKLPGEMELTRRYGVGRSTVRETLNILQQKGIVEKRHGSGTYVIENKKVMENPLLLLSSVGTMIEAAGYVPGSVFKSATHEFPTAHIREKMKLGADERIVVVNRARTADGQPVAFSYNVFAQSLVGNMFNKGLSGSILRMLEEECGVKVSYAESEIKGISHRDEWDMAAEQFLNSPVVLMEQLHFDGKNNPVMYAFDYINTNLVKLNIRREIL
ncbi:MAG: GntR family transcriptional regulator [Roseburia sp.]|nr:GntR family transcriptional regulator [Roseburia sp.]